MQTYKQAVNALTDQELIEALNIYHETILNLADPEWKTTVLKYVRDDYKLEVDSETGSVKICGAEHRNYFGEFLLFDYINIKQDTIVNMLQKCAKVLAHENFKHHGNIAPLIFIQVPFYGTCAMLFLKDVYHPSDTVECMNYIYNYFQTSGIDICIIANDLTTLEINI